MLKLQRTLEQGFLAEEAVNRRRRYGDKDLKLPPIIDAKKAARQLQEKILGIKDVNREYEHVKDQDDDDAFSRGGHKKRPGH